MLSYLKSTFNRLCDRTGSYTRSTKGSKDQETAQSSTTSDPEYHMKSNKIQ